MTSLLPFTSKRVRRGISDQIGGARQVIGKGIGFFTESSSKGGTRNIPLMPEPTNQPKQLGDGGVQERINSGRLLPEKSSVSRESRFVGNKNGVKDLQSRGNRNAISQNEPPIELTEPKYTLSEKAQKYYNKGGKNNKLQALDENYEDLIRRKTGGEREIIHGKDGNEWLEIDSVTESKVIQAKRSIGAIKRPDNFINKSFRNQVKRSIQYASEQNKTPEFWFKYGLHPKVRAYIENKGGIVKTGLGDE